ncbi:MAG: hypothetical protein PF569_00970 [Candidatus Woesearchaeota archaeon]|jgi:protein pelota|nr:hypothetical protein [Candidatus Woesearchaeota archaeon]
MNIISRDNFKFEFLIETLDDLWILSQFIIPLDKVSGKTERKVKIGSETNYKVVKKLIFVELKINTVKFENEQLRLTGIIQNETEFTAVGATHTLSYSLGDKIEIKKTSILKFEEKLIKNAIESKNSHNLLVLLDKDELIASEFSEISFKVLFQEKGLGSKKYNDEQINEEEQKFKLIQDLLKRNYSKIIFAGPSLFKDKLQKYIKDKLGIESLSISFPDVNSNSVQKAIKKINESGVLGDSQLSHENEYISKLLENINKDAKFSYGYDNVLESVSTGSCDVFMITTKLIDKKKEENSYIELNDIMRSVEQINGELVIINSKNEPGKILDGLGGIGAILRY